MLFVVFIPLGSSPTPSGRTYLQYKQTGVDSAKHTPTPAPGRRRRCVAEPQTLNPLRPACDGGSNGRRRLVWTIRCARRVGKTFNRANFSICFLMAAYVVACFLGLLLLLPILAQWIVRQFTKLCVCVCVLACTYAQNLIHRRRVSCAEVGCCCMQGRSQKNTINIFQIFRRKYVFIFECI